MRKRNVEHACANQVAPGRWAPAAGRPRPALSLLVKRQQQAEHRREHDRHPQHPGRRPVAACVPPPPSPNRTTRRGHDVPDHRQHDLVAAHLEDEVLAHQRENARGSRGHPPLRLRRPRPSPARRTSSARGSTTITVPARPASTSRSRPRPRRPGRPGLVEEQQPGSCEDRPGERESLQPCPREPSTGRARAARPTRSSAAPTRSAGSRTGGVQLQVLARRQPRVDEWAVGDVADLRPRGRRVPRPPRPSTAAVAGGRPRTAASTRRSVVLPAPFGPVTSTIARCEVQATRREGRALAEPAHEPSQCCDGSGDGIGQHPGQEHARDHAVHGQERHVHAGQVVGFNRVLVGEQAGDDGDPEVVERARAPSARPSQTSRSTEQRVDEREMRSAAATPYRPGSSAGPGRGRSRCPWSRR